MTGFCLFVKKARERPTGSWGLNTERDPTYELHRVCLVRKLDLRGACVGEPRTMPQFDDSPQGSDEQLRRRVFGAGKKFFEELSGIARTCQLRPTDGSEEGPLDGHAGTRWVLVAETSEIPESTGGRGVSSKKPEHKVGSGTLVYAPKGKGEPDAQHNAWLKRAAKLVDKAGVGAGDGALLADGADPVAAGEALVAQFTQYVTQAAARGDISGLRRAAAHVSELTQPAVAVQGEGLVHVAKNADELAAGWDAMRLRFKERVNKPVPRDKTDPLVKPGAVAGAGAGAGAIAAALTGAALTGATALALAAGAGVRKPVSLAVTSRGIPVLRVPPSFFSSWYR